MQIDLELKNHQTLGKLHHAYLLVGGSSQILPALDNFLSSIFPESLDLKSNPDILWFTKDRLAKDDARFLRSFQTGKDFAGRGRYLVVSFSAMDNEPQEVLLKTLEEPATDSHFFLVVPSADFFRPTILSRVYRLDATAEISEEDNGDLEKFLGLDPAERGDYLLKTFLSDGQIKDRAGLLDWINRLEVFIRERVDLKLISDNMALVFKEIFLAKKLLNGPRASAKMILEHLALVTPVMRKTK
ncbi:MAG: hypothetical protein WCW56_00755 [Candidatus Paceibacterota bacterium]|jgi:hypothetical protein